MAQIRLSLVVFALAVLCSEALAKKDHYRYRDSPHTDSTIDPEDAHYNSNSLSPTSRCRQNYHERTEAGVNRQINLFLHAGYVYNSLWQYFGQCEVALPGFSKFFKQMAIEQREKAESLMQYQNLRGGKMVLHEVTAPSTNEWGTGLEAMNLALDMEKKINEALLELHLLAEQHDDIHASVFVQTKFLGPQVEKIFTLAQYITNLERVGPGLGEYMFDKLPQN